MDRCPICDDELAAVGSRLVCSRDGLLIGAEELGHVIGDLRIVDDGKTLHACPRCDRAMAGVLLDAGDEQRASSRCGHHGIWIAHGALEALLAASRASRSGGGRARKLPAKREPRTPRLASAFVGRTLACPRCADRTLANRGDRWDCAHCEGSFVETTALEAMMSEMTGAPWHLPVSTGTDGVRACPVCTAPLVLEVLEPIQVDHCPSHGVWFDPDELSTLLAASTGVDDRPTGATAWLRRLFFEDP